MSPHGGTPEQLYLYTFIYSEINFTLQSFLDEFTASLLFGNHYNIYKIN